MKPVLRCVRERKLKSTLLAQTFIEIDHEVYLVAINSDGSFRGGILHRSSEFSFILSETSHYERPHVQRRYGTGKNPVCQQQTFWGWFTTAVLIIESDVISEVLYEFEF